MWTIWMWMVAGCVYHEAQDTDWSGGDDLDCVDCCWNDKSRAWEECDGVGDTAADTAADTDTATDTGTPPIVTQRMWMDPDHLVIGETYIVSLLTDGTGMTEVTDLTFVGNVEVLAWSARDDTELLVTLDVPVSAQPDVMDLIVDYRDGSAALVHNALVLEVRAAD